MKYSQQIDDMNQYLISNDIKTYKAVTTLWIEGVEIKPGEMYYKAAITFNNRIQIYYDESIQRLESVVMEDVTVEQFLQKKDISEVVKNYILFNLDIFDETD